jgi:predicted TPR repeat methyltransferase
MQDAKRLHMAGRLGEAVSLYWRVLEGNPRHTEALYGLGMAHAQEGRLQEGERLVGKALAFNPGFAEGWRARGMMLMHLGRREEARISIDRALALKPDFTEALAIRASLTAETAEPRNALAALAADPGNAAYWNNRGSLLVSMGRLDEALTSFEKAVSIKPDFVEALSNRATLLFETNRLDAALAGFDAVLVLAPELAVGWNNRGNTLIKMGRFEDAVKSYDSALAIQPDLPEASENRECALFALGRTSRSPPKYMRGLFDAFSSHYDDTMLAKLQYRGHVHVRSMAERVLPRLAPPLRILDLGCGTGLVGDAFKDLAAGGRLDGIDLSPRMIEVARARRLYDDLIVGDLETLLAEPGATYDLIVSADTMTYLGDLSRAFWGVANRLEPQGFYIFASEAKAGETWEQTKVHRFRHSEAYLRAEAARAGLEFADIVECTLRREENEPVHGFAVALRKPDRAAPLP